MGPLAVMHGKRRHRHVLVLVNDAWQDLMHVHFVSGSVGMFDVPSLALNLRPDVDVLLVRLEDMFRHVAGSWRAINLKWFLPSHNPGREDQVREAERVIGMEMGEKADPEVYWFQSSDTFLASSRSLPDDPGAKINEIRSAVDDDGCRRSGMLRIRRGGSRTKENDLRLGCFFALRLCETIPGEEKQNR